MMVRLSRLWIAGAAWVGALVGPGAASAASGLDGSALAASATVSSSLLAMALDAPAEAVAPADLFAAPERVTGRVTERAPSGADRTSYVTVPEPGAATVVAMFGLIGLRRRHRHGDREELMKHRNARVDDEGRVWRRVAAPGFHGVMGETVWIEDRRARA